VSRHDQQRIDDVRAAIAVKSLPDSLLDHEPNIPWQEIAGMRDRLAHCYFDTSHAILQAAVDHDLPELSAAIDHLASVLDNG